MGLFVNDSLSTEYTRQLRDLRKTYRNIDDDLAHGFEEIIKDRKVACHALPVPGLDSNKDALGNHVEPRVWKYRIPSKDMQRGKSGGFRILSYYRDTDNTLYPFCIYTHAQYDNQPPHKDLKKWLRGLGEMLPGIEASNQPTGLDSN